MTDINNTKQVYVYTHITALIDAMISKEVEVYATKEDAYKRFYDEVDDIKEEIMTTHNIPVTRDDATNELLNEHELYEEDTYGYFTEYEYGYFGYTNYDGTYEVEIQIAKHSIK